MATKTRRIRTGGYYADPASPIASTPQRPRRTGFAPSAELTDAPLSPMKMPNPMIAPPRRDSFGGKIEEDDDGGWRGSIFSPVFQPVLKLVGLDGGSGATALSAVAHGGARAAPYAMNGSGGGSSPHSTLSRSDGTGSSSASSVAACSLGTPTLYAHAAHTPTPPRSGRQPSPITTPSTPTTPRRSAGVEEDSPTMTSMHYTTSSVSMATGLRSPGGVAPTGAASAGVESVHMHGTRSSMAMQQSVAASGAASTSLVAADESWDADVAVDEADMEDVDYEDFNPYLFIKLLPMYEYVAPKHRQLVLPKKHRAAPPISLVLDLDETLVHCSIEPIPDADMTFNVEFNGQDYQVYVRKRPFLGHFLEQVSKMFEVTVFTASQSVYAEKLLNLLDPRQRLIKYRLFREACLNVDGNYLKDLNVLGRDLRHTVLVDNSPHAFGYQVDNGIPIESWFDDPSDTELLKLLSFLKTIQNAKDVRPHVRRKFRMWDLINAA